ncbi:MAG: hypothetical protein ACLUNV_08795 [Sutterella wadsworthensis]
MRFCNAPSKIDPGQWKALALLAIDAWDHEKYAEAAAYWEKLLVVLPGTSATPNRSQQHHRRGPPPRRHGSAAQSG